MIQQHLHQLGHRGRAGLRAVEGDLGAEPVFGVPPSDARQLRQLFPLHRLRPLQLGGRVGLVVAVFFDDQLGAEGAGAHRLDIHPQPFGLRRLGGVDHGGPHLQAALRGQCLAVRHVQGAQPVIVRGGAAALGLVGHEDGSLQLLGGSPWVAPFRDHRHVRFFTPVGKMRPKEHGAQRPFER